MLKIVALLLGITFSLALVRLARKRGPEGERRIYAAGLIVAAILYFIFGLVGRASGLWLMVEGVGVVIYGALALAGLRRRLSLLAFGWAAHVAWDVLLHLSGAGAEYTPHWYPWLCVSFDLVIAIAVLGASKRSRQA